MLGKRVLAARIASGFTQEQLAARTRIPRTILSAIETGRLEPSLETIARVETALGLEPGVLSGRKTLPELLQVAAL